MRRKKIITIGLIFLICRPTIGSAQDPKPVSNNLFLKGIYIENIDALIPWGIEYTQLYNFAIDGRMQRVKDYVKMDSAKILKNIAVNLNFIHTQNKLNLRKKSILTTVYGELKASDLEKAKAVLQQYSHCEGILSKSRNNFSYYWLIDGCSLHLGINKFSKAYIAIQKRNL